MNNLAHANAPDFLGIGFLFDCLESLPGFRMPLPKKIHHFDNHDRRKVLEVALGDGRESYHQTFAQHRDRVWRPEH